MIRYLAQRLMTMVLVLAASSVIVFGFLHLAPGDPAQILLAGRPVTEAALEAVRTKYALDQPLIVQYGKWASRIARGDLGDSIRERNTVAKIVQPRFVLTLILTAYAAMIMLAVGLPVGILSAIYRSGMADLAASIGALVLASVPSYVSAVVLIVVFAVSLNWFPALGAGSGGIDTLYHLTMPAIALALSGLAIISRITRLSMIEALSTEYVETARIRGFSTLRIVIKHALRSALIPVITVSGVVVGYLLSGAVLVEYAFGLNGLGALLVGSVQGRDYAVVQAIALLFTAEFLVINLVVDLLYAVIDPRVRAPLQPAA